MSEPCKSVRFERISKCPVCGSTHLDAVLNGKDMDTLEIKYSILQCPQCAVCITDPQPHPDDLWMLYNERSTADFVPSVNGVGTLRKFLFNLYIHKILRNIKGSRLTVLDYGCGDGLLSLLLSQHPRCEHVTAVDFHSSAPHFITDLDETVSYLSNERFLESSERYDFILCRQVLEHVHDPVSQLKLLGTHMKEDGRILVEVPNFSSIWRRIFGPNWSMLYLPRHLFHYTPASLRTTLSRAGFALEKTSLDHFPGMQSSLYYALGKHPVAPGPLAVLLFPLQLFLDVLCRKSSVIAAVAQCQNNTKRNNPREEK